MSASLSLVSNIQEIVIIYKEQLTLKIQNGDDDFLSVVCSQETSWSLIVKTQTLHALCIPCLSIGRYQIKCWNFEV